MSPSPEAIGRRAAAMALETLAETPDDAVEAVVARHVARAEAYLAAVRRHGSPLYVIDHVALRSAARRFIDAFTTASGGAPVRVYYAVKSNHHPEVIRTLLNCGIGLDVSSGRELETALALGAASIVFSGPGKTDAELGAAVDSAEAVTVLIDSFGELERLNRTAVERGRTVRAGVRLTVNPKGLWRKFGVPLTRLGRFFEAADACPGVDLRGLQFHTSWNMGPEAQGRFIADLGATLRSLPTVHTSRLQFVDVGGGYWPERGEWLQAAGTEAGALRRLLDPDAPVSTRRYWRPAAAIESFAAAVVEAFAEHLAPLADLTLCLEPGRWLCNDGMHLLMSVVDRKGPDLAITDAGTNAVGWERFETDFFPIVNLSRPAPTERVCDVLGCLCTPHDVWGYSYWGADLREGDVLVIPGQGAYTWSLRQDFIKPVPAVASLGAAPP